MLHFKVLQPGYKLLRSQVIGMPKTKLMLVFKYIKGQLSSTCELSFVAGQSKTVHVQFWLVRLFQRAQNHTINKYLYNI